MRGHPGASALVVASSLVIAAPRVLARESAAPNLCHICDLAACINSLEHVEASLLVGMLKAIAHGLGA